MPDSTLVEILTGAGVAGVFCILFVVGLVFPKSVVTDLKEENAELKDALAAERARANTAVGSQKATVDVISALQAGLAMGSERRTRRDAEQDQQDLRRYRAADDQADDPEGPGS